MHQIIETILQFFYPRACLGCGRSGIALCPGCLAALPYARALKSEYDYALYDYGDKVVRKSILAFKYRHTQEPAKLLLRGATARITAFLSEVLQSTRSELLIAVPIPQHKQKNHTRGYNQSALLAGWLAENLEGVRVKELLIKTVPTHPQARIRKKGARIKNIAQSMRALRIIDSEPIYILVDDVTTTGATMNEARRALQVGGGKKIIALALAHGNLSA
ncbi:MAG TPA: hypothetical protein VGE18_02650 [Candidatus Paceibacterota bacterium]